MILQPKNWAGFQHYKDRSPIWIKLHRKLLDNYEYNCLPVASKAIAPLLWLIASEYPDGMIDASEDAIAFRLRLKTPDYIKALKPLISSCFFTHFKNASEVLAQSEQDAILEKRREEERREKEEKRIFFTQGFEHFWNAFDYKKGKADAEKSWRKIENTSEQLLNEIIAGAEREAKNRPALIQMRRTPKMAQGWLTEKRWMDEHVEELFLNMTPKHDPRKAVM